MATANLSDGVANLARQVAIDQYAQDIDFNKKLSAKASIDSPAFTGTPTAPTPTSGDVSTSLATTEFVNNNYLPLSGGTMRGILNMGSKDLKGINWCYANWYYIGASSIASNTVAKEILVKKDNQIYSRTPAQILSDIGAASASDFSTLKQDIVDVCNEVVAEG